MLYFRIGLPQMELLRTDIINMIKESSEPKVGHHLNILQIFLICISFSIFKNVWDFKLNKCCVLCIHCT